MTGPIGLGERLLGLGRSGARRLASAPQIATDTAMFTAGNLAFQGAQFFTYLAAARLLGPSAYGLWNGLLLILANGVFYGPLGALHGMTREVPAALGRGRPEEVPQLVSTAYTAALAASLLLALGCLVASVVAVTDATAALGLRMLALILVLQQHQVFLEWLLRAHTRFGALARGLALLGALLLTVVLGLAAVAGFTGFLWGHVIALALSVAYLGRRMPVRPRLTIHRPTLRRLLRVGLPIAATGFAYSMLASVDRGMILLALGRDQLGYYSISFMAYGTMMLIPRSVSEAVYPRMAHLYGSTGSVAALRPLVYRPLRILVAIMVPALAIVYFGGPVVVRAFLPEYVPGIPAFRIMLLGVFFLSFMSQFGNFLNVIDRQRLFLGAQVGAIALNVALNAVVLALGYGITGVATATFVSQAAFMAALWALAHREFRRADRVVPSVPPAGSS